jgi:hypothetical protein
MFMKTILSLSVLASVLLLSACNSTRQSTSVNDDVYFSPRNTPQEIYTPPQNKTSAQPVQSGTPSTESGNIKRSESQYDYAENSTRTDSDNGRSFDMDDYYDYSYAARIRRFNTNYTTGLGYYDPFYTNIYYYDYNPISFGTSVYTTYGFWNPGFNTMVYSRPFGWNLGFRQRMSWDPFWGWNSAWYGYDPFWSWNNPWNWSSPYYSCWNSPWYWYNGWGNWGGGWGGGWGNNYWNGFNHGYMNGYWNGYHQGLANSMYLNSFDRNQFYYGPRNAIGNNGVASGGRQAGMSFGEKYQRAIAVDRGNVQPIKIAEDGIRNPVIRGNQGNIRSGDSPTLSPSIREEIKNPSMPSRDIRSPKSPENTATPTVRPNSNFDYMPPTRTPETNVPVKTPQGTLSPAFDTRTDKPSSGPSRSNFDQINPGVRNDKTPDFAPEMNPRDRFNNNSRRQEFIRDFSKPQSPTDFDREQVRPRIENTPRYESPRDYSPRNQSPGMENSPRNYDTPRMENSPRNYDTPRMENSPRNYDTPRIESSPRNFNAPRMESTPRNYDAPRSQPTPNMNMSPRNFDSPRMQSAPRMESSPRMQSSPRNISPSMPGGRSGGRR